MLLRLCRDEVVTLGLAQITVDSRQQSYRDIMSSGLLGDIKDRHIVVCRIDAVD